LLELDRQDQKRPFRAKLLSRKSVKDYHLKGIIPAWHLPERSLNKQKMLPFGKDSQVKDNILKEILMPNPTLPLHKH
jgi:hypothetical protein